MADRVRPFIPYDIPLGDGEKARLILPADLTQAEADRLCGVIQTLPFASGGDSAPPDAVEVPE